MAELANTPSSQVFQDSGLKIQAYISFFFKTFLSIITSFNMDPYQAIRNEFSSMIETLQNEIESIKNQPKPHQRPKPSLPDPEKFNGQSLKFDTWLAAAATNVGEANKALMASVDGADKSVDVAQNAAQ